MLSLYSRALCLAALVLSCPFTNFASAIDVEAFLGEPFGVGRVVVDLPESELPQPLGADGVFLTEKNSRLFYPAADSPAASKFLKDVLESDTPLTTGGPAREQIGGILRRALDKPPRLTIYFLFRGQEPLHMTLHAKSSWPIDVTPRLAPNPRLRLLAQWQRQYSKSTSLFADKGDAPSLVEDYLAANLAVRLGLRLPDLNRKGTFDADWEKEIGLTLATDKARESLRRERLLSVDHNGLPADRELPADAEIPPLDLPKSSPDVKVEPISLRVPPECFYVRFGSFANFLWLQDTLAEWGGDAQNLIALKGMDRRMKARIETQLALKQNKLSRLLGDTVIADVAFIGTDMFFNEGAAYGILFQAKTNFILSKSLSAQRSDRIAEGGVKEEKISYAGKDISYIHSPDGKTRSYYATDGDFHFVTTSRRLAERFLASGKDFKGLGATPEFRHARDQMPITRDDVIWLYVSDAFFRNITGSRYRIETARRLQAAADIELTQLAKLTAANEGRDASDVAALVSGGYLPKTFAPLPDGSRILLEKGEAFDDLRGRQGAFTPIPDVATDKVTAYEADEYRRFAERYKQDWGRMEPIVVGIKRESLGGDRERVALDVKMTPFSPSHFAKIKQYAGEPDKNRLVPIAGDLAAFEFVGLNQRFFGGLKDFGPSPDLRMGKTMPIGHLREWLVGYLGAKGDLGFMRWLDVGFPPPDPNGYSQSPLTAAWRRRFEDYNVFSFQTDVLKEATRQLRFEEASRPAQLRLRIGDPTSAKLLPLVNNWAYSRGREASLNNLRLFNVLEVQLHVPVETAKDATEYLYDAKLRCPLGGEYVLQKTDPRDPAFARWTSTVFDKEIPKAGPRSYAAPDGFIAPPWNWFRGLDLEAVINEKTLSAHAEVIMQKPNK